MGGGGCQSQEVASGMSDLLLQGKTHLKLEHSIFVVVCIDFVKVVLAVAGCNVTALLNALAFYFLVKCKTNSQWGNICKSISHVACTSFMVAKRVLKWLGGRGIARWNV